MRSDKYHKWFRSGRQDGKRLTLNSYPNGCKITNICVRVTDRHYRALDHVLKVFFHCTLKPAIFGRTCTVGDIEFILTEHRVDSGVNL